MSKKILIINGPNLNLLGAREPEIYGNDSLKDIENDCQKRFDRSKVKLVWKQSNIEGEIVGFIQEALGLGFDGIVINPAAYSHYSVAILDAMKCFDKKIIEVHLSNTHARDDFRKERLTAKEAFGIIEGFGKESYYLAVLALVNEE